MLHDPDPLYTFIESILSTQTVICQQNNVVNILSSFHVAWFIFPPRVPVKDFLYTVFQILTLINDFFLQLEKN